MIFTEAFWLAALERALKTTAQAAVAGIGVAAVATQVDWELAAASAAVAGLLSLLTSIASAGAGDGRGPSLATERLAPPAGEAAHRDQAGRHRPPDTDRGY